MPFSVAWSGEFRYGYYTFTFNRNLSIWIAGYGKYGKQILHAEVEQANSKQSVIIILSP